MRRLVWLALAVFAVSCTPNIGTPANVERKYIYNSNWDLIATPDAIASRGDLSAIDLAYVAEYNATHTDDQLFVMDTATAATEAPTAKVTFAYSDTNEVWEVWPDLARELVKGNRDGWAIQLDIESAQAGRPCSLYVDREPPPIQEPPSPNLWVALVNITTAEVFYSEYWPTQAEATSRYRDMQAQADINNAHPESMGAGTWIAYIGPTEYGTTL